MRDRNDIFIIFGAILIAVAIIACTLLWIRAAAYVASWL